ncbi:hypothetical protein LTR84_011340 [Exophiala bonariae]|uniref:Zn(2)-C6 fungal-type domain-containing protein n=1 Tax=Exophiala bonariae TaxID=1690606 RepID=A0AAV9MTQ4_9EURO|nr:hypothetical protein LTR84_011340 [Exophiala bonariae]
MVGVAGKSNACKTCKKRKVRCEGEKPICIRCRKGGRVCEGYERVRQFKHLSALDHESLLARNQPLTSQTELSCMIHDHFDAAEATKNTPDLAKLAEHDPPNPATDVSQVPDSSPDLLFNSIPEEVRKNISYGGPGSWLQAIGQLRRKNTLLYLAMSALSMVRLGRVLGSERIYSDGVAKYGRVLKDLQHILASDSLVMEEQNLASCMTLTIFEAMEPSVGSICGWASHVGGISRLFELRGPRLHVDGLGHQLFLGFRATAVIHALALRKPTYLGQSEWLTIPWNTQPKPEFHHLLDIMTQIPTFIDQAEQVHHDPQSNLTRAQRLVLLDQGWGLYLQLKDWYRQLESRHSDSLYTEQPSSLSCPNPLPTYLEDIFPTFFNFQTFEVARMHLFYWTSLLLLYDNILKIIPLSLSPEEINLATSTISPTTLPTTDRAAILGSAVDVAQRIARSMEFLLSEEKFSLSEEMHIRGLLNTLFPLRTAIHVFSTVKQYRPEAWCRAVFDGLAQRGYPFGQTLCGWKWDDIPLFLSGRPPV